MILTEKEAIKKLCPIKPSVQRATSTMIKTERPLCDGSACMKWNWMPNKAPDELEARKAWDTNPKVPVGYCGA